MIAFLDLEMLKMNVFAIVALLLLINTAKNPKKAFVIYFSILLIINIAVLAMQKSSASQNIQYFKDERELVCNEVDPLYRVHISNGWKVSTQFFLKDSLLIRADKCGLYE